MMNRATMQAGLDERQAAGRKKLLLRDGLVFLTLSVVALALYGVTLLLFRSFERHREELAVEWARRGQGQVKQGKPADGVSSLRTALTYAPGNLEYELELAQALADSGQVDQATNYFLNLRESRPGDGFINLQLARLAKKKGHVQEAIDDYHASIFGDWRGDGVTRRRSVRLELIDYLTLQHQLGLARTELLIAAGNAPSGRGSSGMNVNVLLGDKFSAVGDLPDALVSYRKAVVDDPRDVVSLEDAGRIAFEMGQYGSASALLGEALAQNATTVERQADVMAMEEEAGKLVRLSLSRELPSRERAEHLVAARGIAEKRWKACVQQVDAAGKEPASFAELKLKWKMPVDKESEARLMQNADVQDRLAQLIFETELQTAGVCGAPGGDDALLLKLAKSRGAEHPAGGVN